MDKNAASSNIITTESTFKESARYDSSGMLKKPATAASDQKRFT